MAVEKVRSDALVFFGATGDLAYKKIFPALQSHGAPRAARLSRRRRRQVGLDARAARRARESERHRVRRARSGRLREARRRTCATSTATTPTRPPSPSCERSSASAQRPAALPRHPAEHVPDRRAAARRRRAAPRTRASSSRSRSAAISQSARQLNARSCTSVFPEESHLPHRPLPRQGGGAEHPLLPLRQRVPRADLEPALRRERADHDGRELRRQGARQVLRGDRASSATSSRTTCSRSSATSRWKRRRRTYPRGDPRRAGQGPAQRAADERRTTWCAGSSRAIATSPASRRTRTWPTYAALRLYVDSWRWEGVPFYVRAGKSLAMTVHRGDGRAQEPAAGGVQRAAPRDGQLRALPAQPEVAIALGARAKQPGEGMVGRAGRAVRGRREPEQRRTPRGSATTSACSATRWPATRRSSRGRTSSRRPGPSSIRSSTGQGPMYEYEPGTWGPPQADGSSPTSAAGTRRNDSCRRGARRCQSAIAALTIRSAAARILSRCAWLRKLSAYTL